MTSSLSMTAEGIAAHLRHPFVRPVVYDTLSSTNTVLREQAEEGAAAGLLLVANAQSHGRGRMQRSFYSPPGCGIYMSLLLRPSLSPADSLLLTPAAAVAVAETLEQFADTSFGIKWVNDVYLDGKKVCGILTEASYRGDELVWAIVGIGINVFLPKAGYPEALHSIAGSVFPTGTCPSVSLREEIAAGVTDRFLDYARSLPRTDFLSSYRRRLTLTGKKVTVSGGTVTGNGTCLGVDDACRLLVRMETDSTVRHISSGEASVRFTMPDSEEE